MKDKYLHLILDDRSNFQKSIDNRLEGKYPILCWGTEHYKKLLNSFTDDQLVCTWIHIRQFGFNNEELTVDDSLIGLEWAGNLKNDFPNLIINYVTSGKANRVKEITGDRAFLYREIDAAVKSGKVIPQAARDILNSQLITNKAKDSVRPEQVKADVAIIAAIYNDEFQNVREMVKDIKKVEGFETLKYCTLKNSNKKVLIDFQADMGMIDAACLSSQIVENFHIKYLIMIGVCGGRYSKDVRLCDVIIPDSIYDFQTGKYERGKFLPRPRPAKVNNKILVDCSDDIKEKIIKYTKKHFTPGLEKVRNINFHSKTLACGTMVVKTNGYLEGVAKKDDDIVGIEMESFGVIKACENRKDVTALVIKSVMDYTEVDKNDKDKAMAAYISCKFAYFLIKDHL